MTNLVKSEPITNNYSGTETPVGAHRLQTRQAQYQELVGLVEEIFPNNTIAYNILLSVCTAGVRENRVPIWMLLIGAPSSGKTDLVSLFRISDDAYFLDGLTLNAFISGERPAKGKQPHDLLPLLDKKCLIIKDWTVIFSFDEQTAKKIIGDMVGAYDKFLSKFSATRGRIEYNSEFSQIGCITPATLNKHHNYLNMIGPRFLSYRIPELDSEQMEHSFTKLFEEENKVVPVKRKKQIDELSLKTNAYLTYLNQAAFHVDPLSPAIQDFLKTAARFVARARGIVILQSSTFTGEEGNEIQYYEPLEVQIEHPWRAVQQLMALAKYLAFTAGEYAVTERECDIIKSIVISSMPADRADAVRTLQKTQGVITAKELSDQVDKSTKTCRRLLDELCFLGVCKKSRASTGQIAATYEVVSEFFPFVCATTGEFLSSYSISESEATVSPIVPDNIS